MISMLILGIADLLTRGAPLMRHSVLLHSPTLAVAGRSLMT